MWQGEDARVRQSVLAYMSDLTQLRGFLYLLRYDVNCLVREVVGLLIQIGITVYYGDDLLIGGMFTE